jgi:hypothetical protein
MKLIDTAREQATLPFTMQQQRLVATLNTVAAALHDASREMRNQDETTIADYVDTAANQVDHLANTLRAHDLEQLMNTTAQFVQRRPALFLGAAFALGFAATRFLKRSSQSSEQLISRDYATISDGSYGSGYGSASTVSDLEYGGSIDYSVPMAGFKDPPGTEDVPPGERPPRR